MRPGGVKRNHHTQSANIWREMYDVSASPGAMRIGDATSRILEPLYIYIASFRSPPFPFQADLDYVLVIPIPCCVEDHHGGYEIHRIDT